MAIVDLLLERAATVSELAEALEKPKGTVGHHVGVLEAAGLIRLVRTKKVRAIEAKYYGRKARTYLLGSKSLDAQVAMAPDHFLATASSEFVSASKKYDGDDSGPNMSTLRYARIPEHRAKEWEDRLAGLAQEFVSEPRGGELTYGLLIAFYPTERPHLPEVEQK